MRNRWPCRKPKASTPKGSSHSPLQTRRNVPCGWPSLAIEFAAMRAFVPQEHFRIARSFNCGSKTRNVESRRDGRKWVAPYSAVPLGRGTYGAGHPQLKLRAIIKPSLRDYPQSPQAPSAALRVLRVAAFIRLVPLSSLHPPPSSLSLRLCAWALNSARIHPSVWL